MIAHLRGRLLSKQPNQLVLDVNGVGYELNITIPTFTGLPQPGGEVALFVHTHVREDALSLFGFLRLEEKKLFERLIAVSGIGPKLAVTVLSGMPAESLVAALRGNDLAALTMVPGIGKKTAERMVLELRDKLDSFAAAAPLSKLAVAEEDVLSALVNLGYGRPAAEKALKESRERLGAAAAFEPLFRDAITKLRR